MQNWCEGRMKIRGRFTDVVSCLQNSFQGLKHGENLSMIEAPENVEVNANYIESGEFVISFQKTVYIKGSHHAFVEGNCYVFAKDEDLESQAIAVIQFKQGWVVIAKDYVEMSKAYNVDIRIQAFERGMQFSQDVIIENGKITKDEETKYKDWDWDCPVPDWGGRLYNFSDEVYVVEAGDKVAQLIIQPYIAPESEFVGSLEETGRQRMQIESTGK